MPGAPRRGGDHGRNAPFSYHCDIKHVTLDLSPSQRRVDTDAVIRTPAPGPSRDAKIHRFLSSDLGHYVPFALIAAAVLALDQWSKYFVTGYVDASGQGQILLLDGKVRIEPVVNPGAAFGVLPNQTILLTAVAAVIVGALVVSYRRLARGPIWLRIGLGMIMGGATGNLLDRVRLGHVRDFIDLRWWPVFNAADSFIVIGVTMLIITFMVQAEHRHTAS